MRIDSPEGWEDIRDLVILPAAGVAAIAVAVSTIMGAANHEEPPREVIFPSQTQNCSVNLPPPTSPSIPRLPEGGMEITATPIPVAPAEPEPPKVVSIPPEVIQVSLYVPQC